MEWVMTELDLNHIQDRDIGLLSGGELQRFAIGVVVVQTSDVYVDKEDSIDCSEDYYSILLWCTRKPC